MTVLLLIIIGFIAGICFVIPMCERIPEELNTSYWNKKVKNNIMKLVLGGLVGAIVFPLCFTL